MEPLKTEWDLFLWPKTWHKRMNSDTKTLIPIFLFVGVFDILIASKNIFNSFILTAQSGLLIRLLLFVVSALVIGFLDVFCFAWPIADLCRYFARRSEKFIIPGFQVIFMKAYGYSHLMFYPVVLLTNPTGLQVENLVPGTPIAVQFVIRFLILLAQVAAFWQLAILLRTISVKSKLELYAKAIVGAVIYLWFTFEGDAIHYIIHLFYQLFEKLFGVG